MPTLAVESLNFTFGRNWDAQRYDESHHYNDVWNSKGGRSGVDLVAAKMQAVPNTAWMIEAKDFRQITQPPEPSNLLGLAATVAKKAEDTWLGLADAADRAQDAGEKRLAMRARSAKRRRVVLHLEPHVGPHTKLFPASFSVGVQQKLRQLLKSTDPNALVLNIGNTPKAKVPWKVA